MKKNYVDKVQAKIFKNKIKDEDKNEDKRKKDASVRALQKNYSETDNESRWWKLDNAAVLFPSITSKKLPNVFRVSANLTEDVNPICLQKASDKVFERFPTFNIGLKKGLFWAYFEELSFFPLVKEERNYPCMPFSLSRGKHLIRILYYKKKLTIECFHAVADGGGISKFLVALLISYFECVGVDQPSSKKIINLQDIQPEEEGEDAFGRFADLKNFEPRENHKSYQVKGTPLPYDKLYAYVIKMNVNQLKEKSKEAGSNITEFLIANLMQTINVQKIIYNDSRPIYISVPVDLRRRFPTQTLRNFVTIKGIEMRGNTFTEIVEAIRTQFKEINQDWCMGAINLNVRTRRVFFIRIVPLFLKNWIMQLNYAIFGERTFTGPFSNIGKIDLPIEIEPFVENLEFMNGRSKINSFSVACNTCKDICTLGITCKIEEQFIVSDFLQRIASYGIDLELSTNKRV